MYGMISENKEGYDVYWEYLSYLSKKEGAWIALPKEIAQWWHFRNRCKIRNVNGEFQVSPPTHHHNYTFTIKYFSDGIM